MENKYKQPSKEKVISYLQGQGFPDAEYAEDFLCPSKNSEQQYWQAVHEDINLYDFDRWQYFQKVIGHHLDWDTYQKIEHIFCENDIEIFDMPCPIDK